METNGIDLVLDVGANTGQYGQRLRKASYGGAIVSFEPVPSAFTSLARKAGRDANWRAERLALGAHGGTGIDVDARLHARVDRIRLLPPGHRPDAPDGWCLARL